MVGYNLGGSCISGSNNTFLGTNTHLGPGQSSISGSIVLGANAITNTNNQLMVAPTITSFNISGLTASRGTREGTILEFDSSGNIIPSAGTYNSVSKIDTVVADLQTDVIIAGGTSMAIGGESFGTGVTSQHCMAAGDSALKSLTTGSYNTAFGFDALNSITTQASNVGDFALLSCTGNQNTAVGS